MGSWLPHIDRVIPRAIGGFAPDLHDKPVTTSIMHILIEDIARLHAGRGALQPHGCDFFAGRIAGGTGHRDQQQSENRFHRHPLSQSRATAAVRWASASGASLLPDWRTWLGVPGRS